MSYAPFFQLFRGEIASVGLRSEFSDDWFARLEASLPDEPNVLNVPEFAFFATALQAYTNHLGNHHAFHVFMEDVAAKVGWIKSKPKGAAIARKLAQTSPDGPFSALFEIYTIWKIDSSSSATLVALEPPLPDGRNLDAKFDVNGQPLFIECYASMTTDYASRLEGFWAPDTDPVIPKIRNKLLDKTDQASSSCAPVVVFVAPGADFLMPSDKIPYGVEAAFDQTKSRSISAVVFTGGSHPYLCEQIVSVFPNRESAYPLDERMTNLIGAL